MKLSSKDRQRLKTMARTWGVWEEHDDDQTRQALRRFIPNGNLKTSFVNNRYHVQVYEIDCAWGRVTHAAVGRHGDLEKLTWAELQRIKNELFGDDRLAIEVFPPVAHLVDQADLFHLWVMPEGFDLPFGLHVKGAWGEVASK